MTFRPIKPRASDIVKGTSVIARAALVLRDFAAEAHSELATYPPQRTTSYRRTGNLGRKWTTRGPLMRGGDLVVTVGNKAGYAPYVQGYETKGPEDKRQTRRMASRGWISIETVGSRLRRKYRSRIREALRGR